MDAINGVTIEKYAELCALMADTGTDVEKQNQIAEENGVNSSDFNAAKDGFTKLMMDPADMGKTAMAFMPLYQAAQTKMRGGSEPCTIEEYARIHTEMGLKKDPNDSSKKIDFMLVLDQNGYTAAKWNECNSYWTPVVTNDPSHPELQVRYNSEIAAKYGALVQKEADIINGIVR